MPRAIKLALGVILLHMKNMFKTYGSLIFFSAFLTPMAFAESKAQVDGIIQQIDYASVNGDWLQVQKLQNSLIEIGDGAIPFLNQNLSKAWESQDTYRQLCYLLGEKKASDSVNPIGRVFRDKAIKLEVRMSAARALKKIGSPKAIPILTEALKDKTENINIRMVAVVALGEIKGEAQIPILRGILEDDAETPLVQYKAIQVINSFKKP